MNQKMLGIILLAPTLWTVTSVVLANIVVGVKKLTKRDLRAISYISLFITLAVYGVIFLIF